MDFLPPVVAKLIADIGEFKAAFGEAKAETTGFQAAQERMAGAGKVAMTALAVGIAAVGYESVKSAMAFDQAMELVHTQAGASQAEVEQLKQKVLALAPAVGIGPEQLAEGLYHVESAGYRGAQAMDILAASAKAAAIGQSDLESTTQALIGIMASGIGGVKDAADAAAYLNTTVGIGDMRMQQLTAAISTGVLPSFRSAGLQMNDFSAALATITDNATPADEAATRLRMTVALMAAPSQAAFKALTAIGIGADQANKALAHRDELAKYGITVAKLAEDMQKPNGLLVAVMDLKSHLAGLSQPQQAAVLQHAFGGGKTSGAIMTLLAESDRLKDKYAQIGTASTRAKSMQDAWASQQQQFSQQLHQLGAEAQVVGINIGNWLIPKLQAAAGWLAKHQEAARVAAVVIGGVLVAAMVAFTVQLIAMGVAAMANPVVWIVLAIIAAVALLAIGIYELVKHWNTVWGFIKRIALDVWHWLVDAWHATWNTIMAVVGWIKTTIIDPVVAFFDKYLLGPFKFYLGLLVDFWRFVWGFVSVIFADFMHFMGGVWGWWKTHLIDPAKRWLIEYYTWFDGTFIKPLLSLVHWVMGEADKSWHGWLIIFDTAKFWFLAFYHWVDNTFIQPIVFLFDKITGAIGKALSGFKSFADKASGMGGGFAHALGFDEGGWVPGPPGAPMPAIVHGGEYILSRDMISGMRPGGGSARTGAGSMPVGQGTPPAIHIHNHVYLDGKEMHAALIKPAQRYKNRNPTTGLI